MSLLFSNNIKRMETRLLRRGERGIAEYGNPPF
jgi:hypothetical protein